jgi:hypothetical protein
MTIVKDQIPTSNLEPRQISNIINQLKRKAEEQTQTAGGDIARVVQLILELKTSEPGWR